MDPYADRMDAEAREDDDYARRVLTERRDRAQDHVFIPAATEHDEAGRCWACGAPRGARCAAYCRAEQGS